MPDFEMPAFHEIPIQWRLEGHVNQAWRHVVLQPGDLDRLREMGVSPQECADKYADYLLACMDREEKPPSDLHEIVAALRLGQANQFFAAVLGYV